MHRLTLGSPLLSSTSPPLYPSATADQPGDEGGTEQRDSKSVCCPRGRPSAGALGTGSVLSHRPGRQPQTSGSTGGSQTKPGALSKGGHKWMSSWPGMGTKA